MDMKSTSNIMGLDPKIWERLPSDIVENILTKVPFSSLVTFRAVSKEWKCSIIPKAGRKARGSNGVYALFYFSRVAQSNTFPPLMQCLRIWDSKTIWKSTWEPLPSKCLPYPTTDEYVRIVAAEGGLVFSCSVAHATNIISNLFVCNPLLGQCRILPPFSSVLPPPDVTFNMSCTMIGVFFDAENHSYSLVVASAKGNVSSTLIYDSLSCNWKNAGVKFPGGQVLNIGGRGVCYKGYLYWQVECAPWSGLSFVRYDLEENNWDIFRIEYTRVRSRQGIFSRWPRSKGDFIGTYTESDVTSYKTFRNSYSNFIMPNFFYHLDTLGESGLKIGPRKGPAMSIYTVSETSTTDSPEFWFYHLDEGSLLPPMLLT